MAPGVRPALDSVHLHQHAGRGEGRVPPVEVRRHPVPAGRPRRRPRDHQRACRCTATRFRGRRPSSPRTSEDRRDRRHSPRPRAGKEWRTSRSSSRDGGVLLTVDDTADFAVTYGLTHGVSIVAAAAAEDRPAACCGRRSSTRRARSRTATTDNLSIYCVRRADLQREQLRARRPRRRPRRTGGDGDERRRPTGRGTADDPDQPQGRPLAEPAAGGSARRAVAGGAGPRRAARATASNVIPPAHRPRVVLRYGDTRDLLVSGLLDGGSGDRAAADGRRRAGREGARRRSSRTIRSGAARRGAATSWCSTRSSTTTA